MKMKEIKVGQEYAEYRGKSCNWRSSADRVRVVERYVERRDGYYGDQKQNGVRVALLDRKTGEPRRDADGVAKTIVIASRRIREEWAAFSTRMDEHEKLEAERLAEFQKKDALRASIRARVIALRDKLGLDQYVGRYCTDLDFDSPLFQKLLSLAEGAA